MNGFGVLDEAHLQAIKDALEKCAVARTQIALAKSANIDTGDNEKLLDQYEQQLKRIRSVYFPGR